MLSLGQTVDGAEGVVGDRTGIEWSLKSNRISKLGFFFGALGVSTF
jgi:hypothetical protein